MIGVKGKQLCECNSSLTWCLQTEGQMDGRGDSSILPCFRGYNKELSEDNKVRRKATKI